MKKNNSSKIGYCNAGTRKHQGCYIKPKKTIKKENLSLTFGYGSDETDNGLGWIHSYVMIDMTTNELDWDILPQDKSQGHPKSDNPVDVLKWVEVMEFNEHDWQVKEFIDELKALVLEYVK